MHSAESLDFEKSKKNGDEGAAKKKVVSNLVL